MRADDRRRLVVLAVDAGPLSTQLVKWAIQNALYPTDKVILVTSAEVSCLLDKARRQPTRPQPARAAAARACALFLRLTSVRPSVRPPARPPGPQEGAELDECKKLLHAAAGAEDTAQTPLLLFLDPRKGARRRRRRPRGLERPPPPSLLSPSA